MLAPGGTDVFLVFPDQRFHRPELPVVQAVILRQFDARLKPELGLAVCAMDVDVKPGLLSREEKESEAGFTKDCRAHCVPTRMLKRRNKCVKDDLLKNKLSLS
jgi:hypothetical protein